MDEKLQGLFELLDSLPGNYMVFRFEGDAMRYLHHTVGVPALSGFSREAYRNVRDPYEMVLEEDREMIRELLGECRLSADFRETDLLFRLIHVTKGFVWVHMTVRKRDDVCGQPLYIANLLDVNKETLISHALMESSDRFICVIEKATKRFLYANSKFYGLIDSTPAEAMGKHCYELLCKTMEMRDNDNCMCYSAINAEPPIEIFNPLKNMYLTITGREVVWGEYGAYVFYLTDVTEKKQREEQLKDSQARFEVALANSELMVWEYDIQNHRCINSEKAGRDYGIPLVIENYPESLFTMGHTPPETVEQIKDVQRRLLNGETGFSVERRTVDRYGRSQWQKVEYTLECDDSGKPRRAIVCGLDITAQKELEQKYEEQMEYRNKLAQNAIFSVRLDLPADAVLDYTCSEPRLESLVSERRTAAEFLKHFFHAAEFDADGDVSRERLSVDALKQTYALGQSQLHTVYRCSLLNLYLELNLTMYKNPANGHLEVFYVITDVSEGVLMQNAFRSVVAKDYDFVALINASTGKMLFLAHSEGARLPEGVKDKPLDYNELVLGFANDFRSYYHSEEDFRAVTDGIVLSNIVAKLQTMPVYEFNCKTRADDGEVHTFRLSFAYSDATRTQIVFTRANISEAVGEEQRSQQALEAALLAAKAADRAKTDFLARMSHDMRTPMNGIIGMTRLTQDLPALPDEARSNLSDIASSAAYLLQLINDTLDMNKIESNRFTLSPQIVNANEMIRHVLATIKPLADAKRISLEFVPINAELEYVRADRMRLQQMFLNVLSNAVRFTAPEGHVRWEVETLRREGATAYCRISVEDNGCGMSEAFLKHIYEPFSQENTRIVNGQEGTGLGMSIVKKLVELMDGSIELQSKQGVGTKVTIYLHFERVYGVGELKPAAPPQPILRLRGKRVLLAEDHPLNATIARRLLEKQGVAVEHAENGEQAVQLFAESAPDYYDVVLMDIRMPGMDGLEATRRIRELDREDAKTTPILALTANAYASDVNAALAAGMNAHLAKPIEPETLYHALEEYL